MKSLAFFSFYFVGVYVFSLKFQNPEVNPTLIEHILLHQQ